MPEWARQLSQVLGQERCVLVTMDLILGSAPREPGCRMIVTTAKTIGSIGGGNLEFEATARARRLLEEGGTTCQEYRPYSLGPALNQCCGGTVTLLFERYNVGEPGWLQALRESSSSQHPAVLATAIDRSQPFKAVITATADKDSNVEREVIEQCLDMLQSFGETGIRKLESGDETWWLERVDESLQQLLLFGAGHVGQAVARLLADMPFDVRWVDLRPDIFPGLDAPNIHEIQTPDVTAEVRKAPSGSIFVVMTHSHQLDEDICFEVLSRDDFSWLGVIGSATKRRRFIQRLAKRGISEWGLERLVCPIGLSGIKGKQPATIALSLVAQLMHSPQPEIEVANEH